MDKMTQGMMARQLGVTRTYLNSILNGKVEPSRIMARRIAKLTGRSFWEFRRSDRKMAEAYLRDLADRSAKGAGVKL